MAITRVHTWSAGEVLLASDLNSEFNNLLTNASDLVSPFTKAISLGGFALNFDAANTIAMTATTSGVSLTGGTLREPVEDTLTAHAGGTQAAAQALSAAKKYHRISVCATAGDSVALPTSTAGQAHFIRNDGAAAAQVFGTTPDTINSVATASGVALPAGMGAWYVCTTAGNWVSTLVSLHNLTSLTSVAGTNTVTAAAVFPPAAYVVGQVFGGIAANTNTGATTLNISSLGAGAVQVAGAALTGGELLQNAPFRVFVSATTPVFQLVSNGQVAPFLDTNALVKGSADGTKKMRIEADGITTGTTRVLNMPDSDVYLPGLSSATQTANTVYAGPTSGSAAAPTFRALVGADGTGLVLLGSKTAASTASITFAHTAGTGDVLFDWTAYDEYEFHFVQIVPATDAVALNSQISEDSGSTFKSGAGTYRTLSHRDDSNTPVNTAETQTATAWVLTYNANISNTTDYGFNGVMRMYKPSATIRKMCDTKFIYVNSASVFTMVQSLQAYSGDTNAWTGIKFSFSAGNISTGTIYAYGLRKS